MAYLARQKRQSKFYWAELGFMALGLLGLQPSLFTNLLLSSQTKSISYKEPYYQTSIYQPFGGYRDAYLQPFNYAQHQPYTQPSYTQALYAQQPTIASVTGFAQQQNYMPQSAYYQQPQQFSSSGYQTAPNVWANQPAYLAQTNTGYSAPSATANNNWLGAQNLYGNNHSNYQPTANYPSNLYPSNLNSKAGVYPYNTLAPRSAQQQTFGNNTSYYNSGPTNSGSWQRYQAPGSPLYR